MSTSKHIDKICLAAVALTLVLTILFMFGGSLGLTVAARTVKYESTLFDTSYVHKIDIVMNDWESFLESCENEEYASCTVVVDGNKHSNVAIRAKGNTSLSSVKSMDSQRYSFKLEFDHYENGKSLDGLDKLCLNNLIQDNTMMKDYLVYQLMGAFGADSPLCSFVWITVNGEDWGLYLAVEGVEDSFLSRNYGSDAGELYKPDSMSFGGGRGNGKDFNFDDLDFGKDEDQENGQQSEQQSGQQGGTTAESQFPGMPGGDGQQGGFPSDGQFPGMPGGDGETPTMPGGDGQQGGGMGGFPGGMGGFGGFGGLGSDDVKLKYIDDDPDSYPNIFDNAKTDVSSKDQARLISSLKSLSSYTDLEEVLDVDEVLRYFVVHIFVCNGDSYTGSMIHNYYLHEQDGRLAMIPWDYNLAFGTFQGGDASSSVNASIDSPVSGSLDDRPMVGWIFSDESWTEQYHQLFSEFLETWISDGQLEAMIAETAELLRPYVEKDPTKFCTTEDFEKGVTALTEFVSLRGEAVARQLSGDDTAVDTGDLNLSDMGSMGGGGGGQGFPGGQGGEQPGGNPGGFTPPEDPNAGSTEPGGAEASSGGDSQATAPAENETTPAQSGETAPAESGNSSGRPSRGDGQGFPGGSGQQGGFPGGRGQQGGFPGGDGGQGFPGGSGFSPEGGSGSSSGGSQTGSFWLLTGVSVLVLAAGLFIALKVKH